MSAKTKFTKEDEILLQDFSSTVSRATSASFYTIAFLAALAPIYLYYAVHKMEFEDSWYIWAVAVIGVTYILAQAYKNVKHVTKHAVVVKRGEAIVREYSKELAEDKTMSKKEKDERALWKKNEVADYEATVFTIFYNNVLFLGILVFLSFFLFFSFGPSVNCITSMYGAAGLVYLFSTAK